MFIKFRLSLCFFILMLPFLSFGQTKGKNQNISIPEIDGLLDSVHHYYKNVDFDRSYNLANKTLVLSKEIKYKKGIAESLIFLAQNYSGLGEYKKSQEYLLRAEKVVNELNDFYLLFNIHRIKGRNYGEMSLHNKSLAQFKKSLELIPFVDKNPKEKDYLKCITYENLYIIYEDIGNEDSAYYYMNLNKFLVDKIDPNLSYMSKTTLHTFLAKYFTKVEKYDSALHYFQSSEKIAKEFNFPYTSFNDETWGDYYSKRKNVSSALTKYLAAAKNYEDLKNLNSLPKLYNKISLAYQELGDYENSTLYKNKTLEIGVKIYDEKFEAINMELSNLETEKVKGIGLLKILQYSLLGLLLMVGTYILYRFWNYKKKSKTLNKEAQKERDESLENSEEVNSEIPKRELDEIIQLAKENHPEFLAKFQDLYPNFTRNLLGIQPNLQNSELTFSAYLYLNFSTKDIANFTSTSPRTVQTRKYNLRKKLQIPTEDDLYIWIRKINS
jgi:tetratricopeptide (TPR) repeat protein